MKYLLLILTLTFSACDATDTKPIQVPTQSERIANCTEDYMDYTELPTDMDEMDAIDFLADEAVEYCTQIEEEFNGSKANCVEDILSSGNYTTMEAVEYCWDS